MSTYKITLIAMLASLAVVGRFMFQYIPNVQPVTTIIIISAFFLGPVSGILLAVLTTYISNLVMGMGFWTLWQIMAWSILGVMSGFLGKKLRKNQLVGLVAFSLFAGYFYGFIMSLVNYMVTGKFLPYYLLSLPFDTYHAIGNVAFMIVLFPVLSKVFKRYGQK